MNLSGASITVSSEDIKSIIEDFLKVPGLAIERINVDKHLSIQGNYKKFVRIPFKVTVSVVSIREEDLILQIEKVQLGKVSVFKWIKDLALKKFMKTLKEYGITSEKGKIQLHIPAILKQIPIKVNFNLNTLELYKDKIYIEVKKINIHINGQAVLQENVAAENNEDNDTAKVLLQNDQYNDFREDIKSKIPERFKDLLPYVMILPDILALFIRLFKDKRVPLKAKIICGSIITYFMLPIDLLPDFLPIVGKIDDVALAFFALDKMLCEIPEQVIKENWSGKEDIILIIRKGVNLIYKTIGTSNLVKGFSWLAKTVKERRNGDIETEIKENSTNGEEVLCD
jgi:uncharacterized membrane protein YkvA (DUF1232 family)